MSNITELANCPELNFIEHMTLQETEEQLRALYAKNYREITGSDPIRKNVAIIGRDISVFFPCQSDANIFQNRIEDNVTTGQSRFRNRAAVFVNDVCGCCIGIPSFANYAGFSGVKRQTDFFGIFVKSNLFHFRAGKGHGVFVDVFGSPESIECQIRFFHAEGGTRRQNVVFRCRCGGCPAVKMLSGRRRIEQVSG